MSGQVGRGQGGGGEIRGWRGDEGQVLGGGEGMRYLVISLLQPPGHESCQCL